MEKYILSICIPVYNGGRHLYKNVKNILSSLNKEIEVIVSDNCSEDGSIEELKLISDSRLKVFVNKKNEGPFQNWYLALSRGSGKYLMLLQDNDEIIIENLDKFVELCREMEAVVVKNSASYMRPQNGVVSAAEFSYYSETLSHASFNMYKKDAFQKMRFQPDSMDIKQTPYPMKFWDIAILSKYDGRCKIGFINADIKIVRIPKGKIPSRTRQTARKMEEINYTYDWYVHYMKKTLHFFQIKLKKKSTFLRHALYFFMGDIEDATFRYYATMADRELRKRYGVPQVSFSEKEWMEMNNAFCETYIRELEVYYKLSEQYKRLLWKITKVNGINFKIHYFKAEILKQKLWRTELYCFKNSLENTLKKLQERA